MKNSGSLQLKLGHEITQEELERESCSYDANSIPLWLEVDAFYSWLANESKQLSQIGNVLHHPNQLLRISSNDARSVLEVHKADASKRKPFVAELLLLAKTYLLESKECDSLTYSTNDKEESNRLVEDKKRILSFSNEQLELIEKLWNFLQVQIKILDIQLRSKKVSEQQLERRKLHEFYENNNSKDTESFVLESTFQNTANVAQDDSVDVYKGFESEEENVTTYHALFTSDEHLRFLKSENSKEIELPIKNSRICSWDRHTMAAQKAKITKGFGLNVRESTENASDILDLKDEGYDSKTGGSTSEELPSIFDALSVDSGSALQNATKANVLEMGLETLDCISSVADQETDKSGIEINKHKISSTSTVSLCSDEWDEISRVVERFSQNTITLQSWIEELGDVSQQETSSMFCGSQSERMTFVKKHVERVYADVMEDAAVLLKSLTCERSTILAVLQKVDVQCLKYGISVGDDYSELCNIIPVKKAVNNDFLSSKLKNDLISSLSLYEDFKPTLTSTPRGSYETKVLTKVETRQFPKARSVEEKNVRSKIDISNTQPCLSTKTLDTKSSLRSSISSIASEKCRIDFVRESSSVLEWLRHMEMNILRAETSSFSTHKVETLFVGCLHQLNKNKTRRECLNIKANYVGTMFPKLQHEVQCKLSEVDDLWLRLKLKLCHYLTPLTLRDKSIDSRDNELSISSKKSYSRSSTVKEWRKPQPLSATEVPLRDCSFRQNRERSRIGLDECFSRDKDDMSLRQERNSKNETKEVIAKLGLERDDSEYSDVSSYRTSIESSWIEFEGIEDELRSQYRPQKVRPNIYHRQCKPCGNTKRASAEVWPTRTTSLFPKEKDVGAFYPSQDVSDANVLPKALYPSRDEKMEISDSKRENKKLHKKDALKVADAEFESPLVSSSSYFLAGRITEFHLWLKQIEEQTYKQESGSIGWSPNQLSDLHSSNRGRMLALEHRKNSLARLTSSSEIMLNQHKKEISEFFLLWSSWMLEQRYYNLILYSVDMECILERRLEVLKKGISRLSHPTDCIWSDRGVDMALNVVTTDEDYAVLFDV